MSRIAHQYDESDAKGRRRKGSKPRTKQRPSHDDAVAGLVVGVDRGRYTIASPQGHAYTAMKARELGRKAAVVGDSVACVGDTSGREGSLARMVRVDERRNVLRRSGDDTDALERIIVANMDRMVIVVACANPTPRSRMVDRCLVAAHDMGLDPLLCMTKADLEDQTHFAERFAHLDLDIVHVATTEAGRGVDAVAAELRGLRSVLVGHSGVGKSTLVNRLVPAAERETGRVNDVTGRGRHTSSSAVMLPLPAGGWIVDTPGVRSFGLGHVSDEALLAGFTDLAPLSAHCEPGCSHLGEATCAVAAGVVGNAVLEDRFASLQLLLQSRVDSDDA